MEYHGISIRISHLSSVKNLMKLSWARGSETHVCGRAWKCLRKRKLIVDRGRAAEAESTYQPSAETIKLWSQRGRPRGIHVGDCRSRIEFNKGFATPHKKLWKKHLIHMKVTRAGCGTALGGLPRSSRRCFAVEPVKPWWSPHTNGRGHKRRAANSHRKECQNWGPAWLP